MRRNSAFLYLWLVFQSISFSLIINRLLNSSVSSVAAVDGHVQRSAVYTCLRRENVNPGVTFEKCRSKTQCLIQCILSRPSKCNVLYIYENPSDGFHCGCYTSTFYFVTMGNCDDDLATVSVFQIKGRNIAPCYVYIDRLDQRYCLLLQRQKLDFRDADEWCYHRAEGIVEASRPDDLLKINDAAFDPSDAVWVGVTYKGGAYHWISGDVVLQEMWAPGEPSAPNMCVAALDGVLVTQHCGDDNFVVCIATAA